MRGQRTLILLHIHAPNKTANGAARQEIEVNITFRLNNVYLLHILRIKKEKKAAIFGMPGVGGWSLGGKVKRGLFEYKCPLLFFLRTSYWQNSLLLLLF